MVVDLNVLGNSSRALHDTDGLIIISAETKVS